MENFLDEILDRFDTTDIDEDQKYEIFKELTVKYESMKYSYEQPKLFLREIMKIRKITSKIQNIKNIYNHEYIDYSIERLIYLLISKNLYHFSYFHNKTFKSLRNSYINDITNYKNSKIIYGRILYHEFYNLFIKKLYAIDVFLILRFTAATTSGITSPAWRTITVLPGRRPRPPGPRCAARVLVVDPATATRVSLAYGVARPVRPIETRISSSSVVRSSAGTCRRSPSRRPQVAPAPAAKRGRPPWRRRRRSVSQGSADGRCQWRANSYAAASPSTVLLSGLTARPARSTGSGRGVRAKRHAPRSGGAAVHRRRPVGRERAGGGVTAAPSWRSDRADGIAGVGEPAEPGRRLAVGSAPRRPRRAGTPRRAPRGPREPVMRRHFFKPLLRRMRQFQFSFGHLDGDFKTADDRNINRGCRVDFLEGGAA